MRGTTVRDGWLYSCRAHSPNRHWSATYSTGTTMASAPRAENVSAGSNSDNNRECSSKESASSQADGRALQETARNEHNRLFGYRPPASSRARQPATRSNSNRGRPPPYSGRPSNSWNRSFVCLAIAEQQTPPTSAERIELTLNEPGVVNR